MKKSPVLFVLLLIASAIIYTSCSKEDKSIELAETKLLLAEAKGDVIDPATYTIAIEEANNRIKDVSGRSNNEILDHLLTDIIPARNNRTEFVNKFESQYKDFLSLGFEGSIQHLEGLDMISEKQSSKLIGLYSAVENLYNVGASNNNIIRYLHTQYKELTGRDSDLSIEEKPFVGLMISNIIANINDAYLHSIFRSCSIFEAIACGALAVAAAVLVAAGVIISGANCSVGGNNADSAYCAVFFAGVAGVSVYRWCCNDNGGGSNPPVSACPTGCPPGQFCSSTGCRPVPTNPCMGAMCSFDEKCVNGNCIPL